MDTSTHLWNVDVKPMVNANMMQLFPSQIFNPLPHNPSMTLTCPQRVMPASLAKPPHQWSKEEVGAWLAWCAEEFSIDSVSPERFNMNGRAVCLLNRDDFMQRSPDAGDVLYNALQMLIKRLSMPVLKPRNNGFSSPTHLQTTIQPQPFMLMAGNQNVHTTPINTNSGPFLTPPLASPVTTVPSLHQIDYNLNKPSNNTPTCIVSSPVSSTDVESVPSEASSNPDPEEMDVHMDHEIPETEMTDNRKQETLPNKGNTGTKRDSDCRLLWEFIYHLLLNHEYSTYICWDNKERFIFRIVNPHGLAKLWGNQKSRSTMTYEKLSRALRYYYKMEIIKKVPGQRLTYQFMQSPKDIKKGQRGARPHYKLEPFYHQSPCRPTQSVSDQQVEPNDMYVHQAPSTITRRNSNNNHNSMLSHSDDFPHSNGHMLDDVTSVIKTTTDVEHLHSNGLNQDQGRISFMTSHGQVLENSIDRNFATNSKLSRVQSPPSFMGTTSTSPLRSNESPHSVLLKPCDIKTEQQIMQFSNGEPVAPQQMPDYTNSFQLGWTKTMIQDEPEDLSLSSRQRTTVTDTIFQSTSVDNA